MCGSSRSSVATATTVLARVGWSTGSTHLVCKARRPADFVRFTCGGILVRELVSRQDEIVDVWHDEFLVTALRIPTGSMWG